MRCNERLDNWHPTKREVLKGRGQLSRMKLWKLFGYITRVGRCNRVWLSGKAGDKVPFRTQRADRRMN